MNKRYIFLAIVFLAAALNGMKNKALPDRVTALEIFEFERGSRPSGEEIQKKYRELALKFHPDKNAGSREATERFQELGNAYDVLKQQLVKYPPRASGVSKPSTASPLFPSSSSYSASSASAAPASGLFIPQDQFDRMAKDYNVARFKDDFIIKHYKKLAVSDLMLLAKQADENGEKSLLRSIIQLWLFKHMKADPTVSFEGLLELAVSQDIKNSAKESYKKISSSAGIAATGAIIENGILDLSSMEITSLYGLALIENKKTITSLILDNNNLTVLYTGDFLALKNLVHLSINQNELYAILEAVFVGLSKLKVLSLANNQLKEVYRFEGLVNLKYLNLTGNKLVMTRAEIKERIPSATVVVKI